MRKKKLILQKSANSDLVKIAIFTEVSRYQKQKNLIIDSDFQSLFDDSSPPLFAMKPPYPAIPH